MLQLNANAKRFGNEAAVPIFAHSALRQPRGLLCVVTDRKYEESIVIAGLEHGGPNFGRMEWWEDLQEDMAKVLGAGAKGFRLRRPHAGQPGLVLHTPQPKPGTRRALWTRWEKTCSNHTGR